MLSRYLCLLVMALVCSLVFSACEDEGDDDVVDDDDAADDDAADDDAADDDAADDDAADDDAADDDDDTIPTESTVTPTGAGACAPIESTCWIEGEMAGMQVTHVLAATEPDFCDGYLAYMEFYSTLSDEWEALEEATANEDGLAACAAQLAMSEQLEPYWAAVTSAGSCVLMLVSYDGLAPGDFSTFPSTLHYPSGVNLVTEQVALLDGCTSVVDWDSWVILSEQLWDSALYSLAGEWWYLTIGTFAIEDLGGSLFHFTGTNIVIEELTMQQMGTVDFDFHAAQWQ